MLKFYKTLKNLVTPHALSLFASFALGILTNLFTDGNLTVVQTAVVAMIILFTIMAVYVIRQMRDEAINSLNQMRLSAKVTFEKGYNGANEILYDELMAYLQSAQTSIQVVSLYKPPTLDSTQSRSKYFNELEALLQRKEAERREFRFERILQVKEVIPDTLLAETVDHLTFKHCQHLNALEHRNNRLHIRLWQIPDILSPMTFFIVDKQKLILMMPDVTNIPISDEHIDSYELGTRPLGTCFALSDPEGSVVTEFLRLFDTLAYHAYPIRRVIDSPSNP